MLLFVVRTSAARQDAVNAGKGCRSPKRNFSSQVSSGIPLAPSPADPSPCREAQSDSGGCSIACLALGETEVGAIDPLAMENDADFGPGYGFRSRCGLRSSRLAHFDEMMPLV